MVRRRMLRARVEFARTRNAGSVLHLCRLVVVAAHIAVPFGEAFVAVFLRRPALLLVETVAMRIVDADAEMSEVEDEAGCNLVGTP